METASLDRSITRLPPSTGFDELLAPEPEPEPEPAAAPQPARTSGTTARAAAAERRTLLFITFLGCHERGGTQPAERVRRSGAAARFPQPSPNVPNVTRGEIFL